jgi:aspartyl-tRNA(Asn)/glutamyl-tRNA(Gln) amidotransferase subunit C
MAITIEEVKKLASLSRIRLSPEEEISMQTEISSILGYVDQINKANLGDVSNTLPEQRNVWREDGDVNPTGEYTEKILNNAPAREGNYVKVKKIL